MQDKNSIETRLKITREWISKFERSLEMIKTDEDFKERTNPILYKAYVDSCESILDDLRNEDKYLSGLKT